LTPAATFILDHKKRAVPLLRHLALHQSAEALEYRRADCPGCAMDANPANRQNRHFPAWLSRLGFTAPAGEGDDDSCGKPHRSSLGRAREAQLREAAESSWTAERLSVHVRSKLGDSRLFVLSNREPYSHVREGKSVEAVIPASGLVSALQPVLRACDGTWVAHGSGDADRETVDQHDRLRVPPEEPRYTLRRVWLTKEEEEGYYYGFANEGLWPLCHIAHTRPIFRLS